MKTGKKNERLKTQKTNVSKILFVIIFGIDRVGSLVRSPSLCSHFFLPRTDTSKQLPNFYERQPSRIEKKTVRAHLYCIIAYCIVANQFEMFTKMFQQNKHIQNQ